MWPSPPHPVLKMEHHRQPLLSHFADQVIDVGFRADVDAARRFVEEHHLRLSSALTQQLPFADCRRSASVMGNAAPLTLIASC